MQVKHVFSHQGVSNKMSLCASFTGVKPKGALKVCGKVAEISLEAKFLRKAKKFVEICLRYFCTILYHAIEYTAKKAAK